MTEMWLTAFFAPRSHDAPQRPHSVRAPEQTAPRGAQSYTDVELLALLRRGDHAAFAWLVEATAQALQAYAYQYVGSTDRSRDVVQDVFVRLWERRATLEVAGSIRQYLFVATRLRAFELLRRDRIEQRHTSALNAEPETPPIDDEVERVERFARIVDAVRALPARQRDVVYSRWIDGLSNAEVAHRLGISVKGVEIQVTRALAALRSLILRD